MILLDSDVLIEIQRLTPSSQTWIANNPHLTFALPAPVAVEFLIGSRDSGELSKSNALLSQFSIEWLREEDSRLALELVGTYKLRTGLGFADFHIAAQALNRQALLYTFNLKHFKAIGALDARVPYIR